MIAVQLTAIIVAAFCTSPLIKRSPLGDVARILATLLHQSELKMEAAGTHVALHLSSHLRNASWSAQFSFACLM